MPRDPAPPSLLSPAFDLPALPAPLARAFAGRLDPTPALEAFLALGEPFGGRDLVIHAASGGELIAEIVLVEAARRRQRGLYVARDEAAARELHRSLGARDHRISDRRRRALALALVAEDEPGGEVALAAGSFAIAVVSRARLRAILVRTPELLAELEVCVVDEPGASERDPDLEILLTHLRLAERRPRLVGLCRGAPGVLAAVEGDRVGAPGSAQIPTADEQLLAALALHLVAAGVVGERVGLERALRLRPAAPAAPVDVRGLVTRLRRRELLAPGRRLAATRAGRLAALLGLDPQTAGAMIEVACARGKSTTLEILAGLCLTPAGRAICGEVGPIGEPGPVRRALLDRARALGACRRPVFRFFVEDIAALEQGAVRAAAVALHLEATLAEEAPPAVELAREGLVRARRGLARLAVCLRELALLCPAPQHRRELLDLLARRLEAGALERVRSLIFNDLRPRRRRRSPAAVPLPAPAVKTTTRARTAAKVPRWSPFGVIWTV